MATNDHIPRLRSLLGQFAALINEMEHGPKPADPAPGHPELFNPKGELVRCAQCGTMNKPGYLCRNSACPVHRKGPDPRVLDNPHEKKTSKRRQGLRAAVAAKATMVECPECGLELAGYTPRGGDSTLLYASRHKDQRNLICKGSNKEAPKAPERKGATK